jgi:hypothetical protein
MFGIEMIAPRRRRGRVVPAAAIAALLLAMTVRLQEAPATVAEQRARLPPAAECESDIAGRWRAQVYSEATESWYEFTLEVRHVEGSADALTGVIHAHLWVGPPALTEPSCAGGSRYKGRMEGRGWFRNGEVFFGGGAFQPTEVVCGDYAGTGYNPDQFTGRVDKQRQEFQSVNNDGGAAVNEPTVFRRIGCFDDEPRANPHVATPPPFFPARREGGC